MFGLAFFITLILMALVIGVSGYTRYVNPGLKAMKKDVLKLRSSLFPMSQKLIPVEKDELDLLSARTVAARRSGRFFSRTQRGFIHTIYDEPLIAYAIKKYPLRRSKRIYYARTQNSEYVFLKGRKKVQVYIDGKPVGFFEDDKIYDLKSGKALSEWSGEGSETGEFKIGEKKVAMLNQDLINPGANPRVFRYLNKMTVDEKKILLATVVYKILSVKG